MAVGAIYWTQLHSVSMCPTRVQQVSFSKTRITSVKTGVCSVVFPQPTVKYKLCMYVPLYRLPKSRSHTELSMQTSRINPPRTYLMSDTGVDRVHVSYETSTRYGDIAQIFKTRYALNILVV
jgi:hypothetical protein